MTKGADAFVQGVKFEIKSVKNANGVYGNLRDSINRGQANRFIIDGSGGLTEEALNSGLRSLENRSKKWDEIIAILGNGRIIRLPGDVL